MIITQTSVPTQPDKYPKAKSYEPAAKTHDLDCEVKEGSLEEIP